jgi:signal transduction histidine kinase
MIPEKPSARGRRGRLWIVIALAAGLAVVAAAILSVLLLRAMARLREVTIARAAAERGRGDLAALADTVPLASIRWPAGEQRETVAGLPGIASWPEFLERLAPADAARIEEAVAGLRRRGTPVSLSAAVPRAGVWRIEGRRTASGESVLWLFDASAEIRAEDARSRAVTEAAALRAMLDAIPLPVWRRGSDLALADCNRAYAAAFDATPEQALEQGCELPPGGGRNRAAAALPAGAHNERGHVVISGSRRLLDITETATPLGGTVGFAVDRTDVENAEGELWRHVHAHAEVLETIHAAVAIYGADRRLKFANTAFARLWGLEEEWLAGEPSIDEVLERLRERRRLPEVADFRAFRRQSQELFTSLVEPQQQMVHLPDGRTLQLTISPHPLGGLMFVYDDVTDRLALERSYNTLTEVQRATLDHLFEGIAVYGSDGRLKLHNPAYRRMWNLSLADVADEPHVTEIVDRTRAFFDDDDWSALRERIIASVTAHSLTEGRFDRRDGSVLEMATVPLPDGNVLLTWLDVTDTVRVERALRERNEALETAGRLKSEFIANVSYELRTPLNAVIGFAEMLANQYFGTLNERQLDYSRAILESAHQLMSLINDILDLATIEAGYFVLEPRPVDIAEMLRGIVTLTHERARNQGLALECRCPPDIGTIEADERRLKQALFNLVSNALRFTPEGGSVSIAAERKGGDLLLVVSDTGIGIPAADQARVFEKFERGSPRTRHSGAGLGLALVKNLIELHGGAVELDSQPGRGTIVTCRLPTARADKPAESALAE